MVDQVVQAPDAIYGGARLSGHDVLTVQEAGQAQRRISDAGVLAFAIGKARSVVTFNRRHFVSVTKRFGIDVLSPAETVMQLEKRS